MPGWIPTPCSECAPVRGDQEIAAAYREAAKRWHPDIAPGEDAARRMAEINAAYDLVRAAAQHGARARGCQARRTPADRAHARSRGKGNWLIPPLRLALGPELLDTLNQGEEVKLVTPTSTWASPRAILAVTERRLLWLLDDAPVARVHSLVVPQRRRDQPPRRAASTPTLTVRTIAGRRHVFHDLRPHTAATYRAARLWSDPVAS